MQQQLQWQEQTCCFWVVGVRSKVIFLIISLYSYPLISKGLGSRNPHKYPNKQCSRWLHKMEQCLHITYTNLPHNLNHLQIIYNSQYYINIILNIVILYCLGNNNEKKVCTWSVQTIFKKYFQVTFDWTQGWRRNQNPGAHEMGQWVKAHWGPEFGPQPHPPLVGGKNQIQQVVLWPPHTCYGTSAGT